MKLAWLVRTFAYPKVGGPALALIDSAFALTGMFPHFLLRMLRKACLDKLFADAQQRLAVLHFELLRVALLEMSCLWGGHPRHIHPRLRRPTGQ